jgi:hypothetical protein
MLDLATVTQAIEQWIVDFVEVPHPALGGWAPCPYARKARLEQDYEVRLGTDPYVDLLEISKTGLNGKSVVVVAYDPAHWEYRYFSESLRAANIVHLLDKDLLALEDHPADPEIVNGVSMNQGTYALALVQGLSDLNEKARLMARKEFYATWPEEYLQALFENRKDPRL